MVMLVIVLGSIGVPTEGLILIFGVDRLLDMLRTVVNVTGDTLLLSQYLLRDNLEKLKKKS